MNEKELLERMDLVDPDLVEQADLPPKALRPATIYRAAVAAVMLVAAAAVLLSRAPEESPSPSRPQILEPTNPSAESPIPDISEVTEPSEVPMPSFPAYLGPPIPLAPIEFTPEGIQMLQIPMYDITFSMDESFLYKHPDSFSTPSPWSEDMNITSLPVFRNNEFTPYPQSAAAHPLSETRMLEKGSLIAERMNYEIVETKKDILLEYGSHGDPYIGSVELIGRDGQSIRVNACGEVRITVPDSLLDPEKYNLEKTGAPDGQTYEGIRYLTAYFSGALGFSEGIGYVSEYDTAEAEHFRAEIGCYDGSGDNIDRLLSYNFRRAVFEKNSGESIVMRIAPEPESSEKVGDYPIISLEEAKQRLQFGMYQTSCSDLFPGLEDVVGVTLGYRHTAGDEYSLPYYIFYVNIGKSHSEDGLYAVVPFYVPAIKEEYMICGPLFSGISVADQKNLNDFLQDAGTLGTLNNSVLAQQFDDPGELNVWRLLIAQQQSLDHVTEKELEELSSLPSFLDSYRYMDGYRIPRQALLDHLSQIGAERASLDGLMYLERTDSYYLFCGGADGVVRFTFLSALQQDDGSVQLLFSDTRVYRATLVKDGSVFRIVRNQLHS